MTQQHARKLLLMVLACACATSLSESLYAADRPGTTRFFFEYLSLDGSGPDWEAEGSRRIVVDDPDTNWATLQFGFPDYVTYYPWDFELYDGDGKVLLDLAGTTWVRSSVLHITAGGIETVYVYWLVNESEDPDELPQLLAGLTAATGPDGDVCVVEDLSLGTITGTSGQFLLRDASNPVRFSVGLFNK